MVKFDPHSTASSALNGVASSPPYLCDFIPCPQAAYHEAGHFVTALLFGIDCDYVEAHSTKGVARLSATVPVRTDWKILIMLRAGRFAEGIPCNFTHRPTLEELERDLLNDQATGFLGRSDLSKIIAALVAFYGDDFMTQYRALEVTTIDILSRNHVRGAIRAVAGELMRLGRLPGADATEIASRHIVPGSLVGEFEMSILDKFRNALRSPDATLAELQAALAAIDVDALDAEVERATRARTALLLDGTEAELDEADAALKRATREKDKATAARGHLKARIAEAETAAADAALDAERHAVEREAEAVKRELLKNYVGHQKAMVEILERLKEAEDAVRVHNERRLRAGRTDFLASVETRAFPVPRNQYAGVYSILRRTSFRAVGGAPSWNDDLSDFLVL